MLKELEVSRFVPQQPEVRQVLAGPLVPGGVYPGVYLTRPELEEALRGFSSETRIFVVLRDLRDTLVSLYFSYRYSHPALSDRILRLRRRLGACDLEEGLLYLLKEDHLMDSIAAIQLSWLGHDPLYRYEDLVAHPFESMLEIARRTGLEAAPDHVHNVVERNSFRSLTGRARGEEDRFHFRRKALPGDWREYFTPAVLEAFEERHRNVLEQTGYCRPKR